MNPDQANRIQHNLLLLNLFSRIWTSMDDRCWNGKIINCTFIVNWIYTLVLVSLFVIVENCVRFERLCFTHLQFINNNKKLRISIQLILLLIWPLPNKNIHRTRITQQQQKNNKRESKKVQSETIDLVSDTECTHLYKLIDWL